MSFPGLKLICVLPTLVGAIYGTIMYMIFGGFFGGVVTSIAIAVFAALAATLAPNFGIACLLSALAGVIGASLLLSIAVSVVPPDDPHLINVFVYSIWASSGGYYGLLAGMLGRGALRFARKRT